MSIIKKACVYSLLMATSINFALDQQSSEINQDHHDFTKNYSHDSDEIYPIEDTNTICFISEIQNYIDELEIDPIVIKINETNASEHNAEIKDPIEHEVNNVSSQINDVDDAITTLEELFVIFDEIESFQIQNDDTDIANFATEKDTCCDMKFQEQNNLPISNKSELVNHQNDGTIDADNEDEDDIIPVPHDLINSVKKATKKQKKLEKKAKTALFKKNKKINKKKLIK